MKTTIAWLVAYLCTLAGMVLAISQHYQVKTWVVLVVMGTAVVAAIAGIIGEHRRLKREWEHNVYRRSRIIKDWNE